MKKLVTTVTTAVLLTSVMAGVSFAKPAISKNDPAKVIAGYFDATKASNYLLIDEYGTDTRFSTFKDLKTFYSEVAKDHPLLDYTILSSKQLDDTHVEFLVQASYKDQEPLPAIPYTVVKENGEWTVLVEPIEIDFNQESPEFGKVKKSTTKLDISNFTTDTTTATLVSPEATDILYWNFYDLGANSTIVSSNSFTLTRQDGQVTLNGWQDNSRTTSPYANMSYQAVKVLSNVTTKYGQPASYYGNNRSNWYAIYLQGVPASSGYKLAMSNLGSYVTNGAGNAYE